MVWILLLKKREPGEELQKKDQEDGTMLPLPATARDAAAGDFPENR